MNTPAISNLINVTSTPTPAAPAAKQPGTSPDTQFNQMLWRGIEQRRNLNEPSKPHAKESSPAKQASQSTQSTAAKNDADAGEESTSTSIDEQAAATPAAETPAGPTKAKAEVDAESEDDEAVLAASSDELLALVASLTQASTVAADASVDAPVDAAAGATVVTAPGAKSADLTSGIDASASVPAQTAGRADAAAQAALTASPKRAASEAATSGEPDAAREFDASLAQVKDHKDAADANAVPAHAQSNKNDPTAATQSGPELRAAKAAVDTQPAAAPVASINVAPQSPVSMQHVQAATAAAAAATDKLTPRVGSNNWDQALGQKVVWMVAGEQQSASLTLNPPDLGPLQVVLSVSNSQATVNFTAAQPEVRQALENAVPKLREMLGDAGIQLGQANVSAGTPNNQQGGFGEGQHASRGTGPKIDDDANAPVHTVRSQTIVSGGRGLVDTFA
jgi:flagellar hook-length control protein FliK